MAMNFFGTPPKQENLADILSVFDTVTARLDTFQAEQEGAAVSERAEIEALQASLAARTAEIERAARVRDKVTAITT
jgi:protein-arginine kinase activator protein McsA